MLMCGNDNFVGRGVSEFLKSKDVPIKTFRREEMISQSSLYRHHTMLFNIIDNGQSCADFVDFLNKNRFKVYDNNIVIITDSLVAKLCVELLYVDKAIVLTEKSPLRDFNQITSLSQGTGHSRLFRSQKRLTDREQQILSLLVGGYNAKEISELVNLNYKTIQTHKMKIILKLGLTNSADLNKLIVRFNHSLSFLP